MINTSIKKFSETIQFSGNVTKILEISESKRHEHWWASCGQFSCGISQVVGIGLES